MGKGKRTLSKNEREKSVRKEKKKKFRKYLLSILAGILMLRICCCAVYGNIPNIDEDSELVQVFPSPDQSRTVEVHLCYGSLTTCDSIRCRVYGEGIRERSFFRLYHGRDAEVTWLDENRIFIEATTCGNEMYWLDTLPAGSTGIVLDVRGEWFDNGDLGGIGRDGNGKVFLHRWWRG